MPTFNVTPQAVVQNIETVAGFFTSTKRVDVVQVLDQESGQQVFAAARPIAAFVRECSKGLTYPIETGATLTDSIIIEPTEISISMLVQQDGYATVYPQIRTGRISGTLYTVQTRTGTYKNMFIEEMPHDETCEMMSAIKLHLKFKEALFVVPTVDGDTTQIQNNYSPREPQDSNTIAQGLLSGVAAGSSALSWAHAASMVGL